MNNVEFQLDHGQTEILVELHLCTCKDSQSILSEPINTLSCLGKLYTKESLDLWIESKGYTRPKLEDDPLCGITTGGRDNCEWDCEPDYYADVVYENPRCFMDCFENDHCVTNILIDYMKAGGVCRGSSFDEQFNDVLPSVVDFDCELETIGGTTYTTKGIFRRETLESIYENETCIFDVHRASPAIFNTVTNIVYTSSDLRAYRYWAYFADRHIKGVSEGDIFDTLPSLQRLQPGLR